MRTVLLDSETETQEGYRQVVDGLLDDMFHWTRRGGEGGEEYEEKGNEEEGNEEKGKE